MKESVLTREEFLRELPEVGNNYQPSDEVLQKIGRITLVMIIGPSGVGKSSVIKELGLPYVPSDTSRPIRPGEKNGVDYFFREDYEHVIEDILGGRFVQINIFSNGEFYATRESSYPNSGTAVIAVAVAAIPVFRSLEFERTISAFIVPPAHEEWMRRLSTHPMSDAERQNRLSEARSSYGFALSDKETHLIYCEDQQAAADQIRGLINGKVDVPRETMARTAAMQCLDGLN